MQVCFLDHYDSFSFNLIDWLFSDTGLELVYKTHDEDGAVEFLDQHPMPLILSPGPKEPSLLPVTMQILEKNLYKVPILGICLGHQCLGLTLGGRMARAKHPFHGSSQTLRVVQGSSFLGQLPRDARVARYNSLVVEAGSLPESLVTAWNEDNEIEAIEDHSGRYPAVGLQFHPESFLSMGMEILRERWVQLVKDFYQIPAGT